MRALENNDSLDLDSSQYTPFVRLSTRGRADVLGFAKPEVQGLTKTESPAALARADAKEMEAESFAADRHAIEAFGP